MLRRESEGHVEATLGALEAEWSNCRQNLQSSAKALNSESSSSSAGCHVAGFRGSPLFARYQPFGQFVAFWSLLAEWWEEIGVVLGTAILRTK